MQTFPQEVEDSLILAQDKFVWESPAHTYYERGPKWYVFMSLAAVFLVAYAVWTANFLFAFIILLSAILILLAGHEKPSMALVQIGDHGVVWNGKLMLFRDLDQFAIVYQPPQTKVLYLLSKQTISPRMRIELENQDPVQIRQHLCQYIPENLDLRDEYTSDILARLLKI